LAARSPPIRANNPSGAFRRAVRASHRRKSNSCWCISSMGIWRVNGWNSAVSGPGRGRPFVSVNKLE
jgi:hypothetical protein